MIRHYALALAIISLTACTPDPNYTPEIAKDQLKAMDKAKALEGSLQEQADQQMEQIDEQTQ